jgi:hypothetical protein
MLSCIARLAAFATIFLSIAVHTKGWAQPDPSLADVPLPRLQEMVEPCELQRSTGEPMTALGALCALAADELRRRAFAGDNERLLAWWRDEQVRRSRATAQERPAMPAAKTPPGRATPEQLKSDYLHCERLAQATLLDFGTAGDCSMVYEELKQRVFGGDFHLLLAWWRQQ